MENLTEVSIEDLNKHLQEKQNKILEERTQQYGYYIDFVRVLSDIKKRIRFVLLNENSLKISEIHDSVEFTHNILAMKAARFYLCKQGYKEECLIDFINYITLFYRLYKESIRIVFKTPFNPNLNTENYKETEYLFSTDMNNVIDMIPEKQKLLEEYNGNRLY